MASSTIRLSVRSLFPNAAELHCLPSSNSFPIEFSADYERKFPCILSHKPADIQFSNSSGLSVSATFKVAFHDVSDTAIIAIGLENGIPKVSIHPPRNIKRAESRKVSTQGSHYFYSLESSAHDGAMSITSQHILRGALPTRSTSFLWVRLVFAPVPSESSILSISANPKQIYNLFDDSAVPIIKGDVLGADTQCLIWQDAAQKQRFQGYPLKPQQPPVPVAFRRSDSSKRTPPNSMFVEFVPGLDIQQRLSPSSHKTDGNKSDSRQWWLEGVLDLPNGTKMSCLKTQPAKLETNGSPLYRNHSVPVYATSELAAFALSGLKGTLTWHLCISASDPFFAQAKTRRMSVGSIPSAEFYCIGSLLPRYFSIESDHIATATPEIPISLLRQVLVKPYPKREDFLAAALEWGYRQSSKALAKDSSPRYFSHDGSLFHLFNYVQEAYTGNRNSATSKDQAVLAKILVDLAADSPNDWARLHVVRKFGPLKCQILGGDFAGATAATQLSPQILGSSPGITLAEHWIVEVPNVRGDGKGSAFTDITLDKPNWIGFTTKQEYIEAYRTVSAQTPGSGPRSPRRFNFAIRDDMEWQAVKDPIVGFAKSVDFFNALPEKGAYEKVHKPNNTSDVETVNKSSQNHHASPNGHINGTEKNKQDCGSQCDAPWTNDILCQFLEDNFPAQQVQLDLQAEGPKLWATWTITPESPSFKPATLSIMAGPNASTATSELEALVNGDIEDNDSGSSSKHYHLCKTVEFPHGAYETDANSNTPGVAFTVANLLIVVEDYPSLHRTRRVARSIQSYASRHIHPLSQIHRPTLAHKSPKCDEMENDDIPMGVIRIGQEAVLEFEARDFVTFSIGFYGKGEILVVGEEQDFQNEVLRIKYAGSKVGVCGVVVWLFHRLTFAAVSRSCVVEVVPAAVGRSQFKAT